MTDVPAIEALILEWRKRAALQRLKQGSFEPFSRGEGLYRGAVEATERCLEELIACMNKPEIFEVWWFAASETLPKPVYSCAMPSPWGQHHKVTACMMVCGEHVCYIEAKSLAEAMLAATARHPDWEPILTQAVKERKEAE